MERAKNQIYNIRGFIVDILTITFICMHKCLDNVAITLLYDK